MLHAKTMKIELWGTYPPPIGGVSIHLYRLVHRLYRRGVPVLLRNFGESRPRIPYVKTVAHPGIEFLFLLLKKKRIIHLHSNRFSALLLLLVLGIRHKIGITLHNQNLIREKSFIKKMVIRMFFHRASFVIMNDKDYCCRLCDAFGCDGKNFHILPAFLPPEESEYLGLGEDVLKFRQQHSFLISANAYKLRYENEIDIYGLDLLIRLVHAIKSHGIDVGLVFCLPMIGDEAYYRKCLQDIEKSGISDNVLILQKEIPNGFEIWQISDLFIRPTYTDIEGISVKEALYGGTPVIASDVCERPEAAVLFRSRDYADLEAKFFETYNRLGEISRSFRYESDTVDRLLKIYGFENDIIKNGGV